MSARVLRLVQLNVLSIGLILTLLSNAVAADPLAIRDILDDPRIYHLKQVVLQGTVRSVQPLDPYKLPAGTTCYGAYLFYLEDETASINVAVFGLCGVPTVKDPDVEDGAVIGAPGDRVDGPGRGLRAAPGTGLRRGATEFTFGNAGIFRSPRRGSARSAPGCA